MVKKLDNKNTTTHLPNIDQDAVDQITEYSHQFAAEIEIIQKATANIMYKSELRERVNAFYSSYYQKELATSNRHLTTATWVLALATILFTISNVYGPETADSTFILFMQIALATVLLGGFFNTIFNIQATLVGWWKQIQKCNCFSRKKE